MFDALWFSHFLWFWFDTIIASFTGDVSLSIKLFKKIADEGYKINYDRLNQIQNSFSNPDNTEKFYMFIPIMNMMFTLKKSFELENYFEMFISELKILGIIEEMTEEELLEYKNNPTFLTAYFLTSKLEDKTRYRNLRDRRIENLEELKKSREELVKELEELKKRRNLDTYTFSDEKLIIEKTRSLRETKKYINEISRDVKKYEKKLKK